MDARSHREEDLPAGPIMVVDDDKAIADLVASLLSSDSLEAVAFTDPVCALEAACEHEFSMAIIDIMMPAMDGFELCHRIRAKSDMPILFLSARDEETDQVIGFTMGADDYVTKPFKPRELVARVRAHLRRAQRTSAPSPAELLEARGIAIDTLTHKATLHDQELSLTPKEFSILALLVENAGKPVSTASIYESVWGEPYDIGAANTVMVHIRHLRTKLADLDSSTPYIETVWGVGYHIPEGPGGSRGRGSR